MKSTLLQKPEYIQPYFIGDARIIMGDDEAALLRLWRDMGAEVKRVDLPVGVSTEDPNRRSYEAITCGMPIAWHVVGVCYATAAILLGYWPWNLLLLLLLFPIMNKRVRFYAFRAASAKQSMHSRMS